MRECLLSFETLSVHGLLVDLVNMCECHVLNDRFQLQDLVLRLVKQYIEEELACPHCLLLRNGEIFKELFVPLFFGHHLLAKGGVRVLCICLCIDQLLDLL